MKKFGKSLTTMPRWVEIPSSLRENRRVSTCGLRTVDGVPFLFPSLFNSPFRIQINPTSPLYVHRPKSTSDSVVAGTNGHDVESSLFLFRHDPRLGELDDGAVGDLDVRQIATLVVVLLQAGTFAAEIVRGLGGYQQFPLLRVLDPGRGLGHPIVVGRSIRFWGDESVLISASEKPGFGQ